MHLHTVGSVLISMFQISLGQLLFRTSLKVSCLETTNNIDKFDCTMHISKIQFVYGRGSFMSRSIHCQSDLFLYLSKQLTVLFHTQPKFTSLLYLCVAPTINCIIQLKPSAVFQSGPTQRTQQTQTCYYKQASCSYSQLTAT